MTKTRSQQLALAARERVAQRAGTAGGGIARRYRSRVAHLAIWIRENGLLQTLAFLQDKAKAAKMEGTAGAAAKSSADGQLLDDLAEVLKRGDSGEHLIRTAESADATAYRLLVRDAIAACLWLKRCCEHYPAAPAPGTAEGNAKDAGSPS